MQYIRFLLPVYAYPNSIGTQQSHRVNKADVDPFCDVVRS